MERSGAQEEQSEQIVLMKYKQLQSETSALVAKILEIEEEKKEHDLVSDTLKGLEDSRKCWRLVNGVLFEKTRADVIPELESQMKNMDGVIRQLSEAVALKKQEIFKLEQQYESVMKQAKIKQGQQAQQQEVKAGGVLV
ncbi:hypothetical protein FGO68_gene1483 [Halteria grandinella]|uniref:Prefoldin subunit 2 n=1 Tax=Halteria grandinella TaxID=5974 RepID=A0A8J8SZB8_HALGN|nr:hypothetical protein FGO68_gene1483 [Halteria grandinella]